MEILLQLVFSGIALGMIYAVIAFGYQLTFATPARSTSARANR
jgi:branched-chain amino acid transport system permease protein